MKKINTPSPTADKYENTVSMQLLTNRAHYHLSNTKHHPSETEEKCSNFLLLTLKEKIPQYYLNKFNELTADISHITARETVATIAVPLS